MEILCGLNLLVVQRLTQTWKVTAVCSLIVYPIPPQSYLQAVPNKPAQTLKSLWSLMDSHPNWQNYRTEVKERSLPVLPFPGMDDTFICMIHIHRIGFFFCSILH